jgi:hypothetical protein
MPFKRRYLVLTMCLPILLSPASEVPFRGWRHAYATESENQSILRNPTSKCAWVGDKDINK